MLIRIIILLLVIIGLYRLYMMIERNLLQKRLEKQQSKQGDKVIKCHQCDLYIPGDEVIEADGKQYCSNDCLEKDRQTDD